MGKSGIAESAVAKRAAQNGSGSGSGSARSSGGGVANSAVARRAQLKTNPNLEDSVKILSQQMAKALTTPGSKSSLYEYTPYQLAMQKAMDDTYQEQNFVNSGLTREEYYQQTQAAATRAGKKSTGMSFLYNPNATEKDSNNYDPFASKGSSFIDRLWGRYVLGKQNLKEAGAENATFKDYLTGKFVAPTKEQREAADKKTEEELAMFGEDKAGYLEKLMIDTATANAALAYAEKHRYDDQLSAMSQDPYSTWKGVTEAKNDAARSAEEYDNYIRNEKESADEAFRHLETGHVTLAPNIVEGLRNANDALIEGRSNITGRIQDRREYYPQEGWTEEQRRLHGYLYATDREKADQYAMAINQQLNYAAGKAKAEEITEDGITAGEWAKAQGARAAGGVDYLLNVMEYNMEGAVSGNPHITNNNQEASFNQIANAVDTAISNQLNGYDEATGTYTKVLDESIPVIGGKGWGDAYQLGMSILQSTFANATGKVGTYAIFFGSAAQSAYEDAMERGATQGQALIYGMFNGIAEGLFEAASFGEIKNIATMAADRSSVFAWLRAMGLSGAIEADEELNTGIADLIIDAAVMCEKSKSQQAILNYMSHGMSYEEAWKKAFIDNVDELAYDALGGFVSGSLHGSLYTGVEMAKDAVTTYQGDARALMQEANEAGVKGAREVGAHEDVKLSNYEANKLQAGLVKKAGGIENYTQQRTEKAKADYKQAEQDFKTIRNALETLEMNSADEAALLSGFRTGNATAQEYAEGVRQAFTAGRIGLSLEQARGQFADTKLSRKQFENAHRIGQQNRNPDIAGAKAKIDGKDYSIRMKGSDTVVFTTANGKTIEMPRTEALTREGVTMPAEVVQLMHAVEQFGENAGEIYNLYTGNMGIDSYAAAMNSAIHWAESGVLKERIESGRALGQRTNLTRLTDEQIALAEKIGEARRAERKASAKARSESFEKKTVKPGKTGRVITNGAVTARGEKLKGIDFKNLNKQQKDAVKAIRAFANLVKIDYVIYDGVRAGTNTEGTEAEKSWGFYEDGRIYLNINAGTGNDYIAVATLAHELTHFMQDFAAEEYGQLKDEIVKIYYNNDPAEFERIVDLRMRTGGEEGKTLSYDAAVDEVIANSCMEMLNDANAIDQLCADNPTLGQYILNFLKKLISDIFGDINHIPFQENAFYRAHYDAFNNAQNLFAAGLKKAAENAQKGEAAESSKRYMIYEGMSEEERYEELKDKKIVPATVDPNRISSVPISELSSKDIMVRKDAFRRLASNLGIENVDLKNSRLDFPFTLTNRGLDESTQKQEEYSGTFEDYAKALSSLDELVENAELIEVHKDYKVGSIKQNIDLKNTYVLVGALREGELLTPVELEVKEYKTNTSRLYLVVTLSKIKSEVIGGPSTGMATGDENPLFSDNISLQHLFSNVNPKDENFLKYVPDGFLNAEQKKAKQRAIERQIAKYGDNAPGSLTPEQIKQKYKDSTNYLSITEHDDYLTLDNLVVHQKKRNKGIGQSILQDLMDYADRTGKIITLTPTNEYGRRGKLREWYKKNGFVDNKGRNARMEYLDTMYRLPASSSAANSATENAAADLVENSKGETAAAMDAAEATDRVYSRFVEDEDTLKFLDEQEKAGKVVKTYKSFLKIDGKLYPPMASLQKDENGKYKLAHAMEEGRWEESVGNPKNVIVDEKTGKGYYNLKKDNGKTVKAAYNPYQHSSNLMLNDQFEEAYQRPQLVTYECIIPESELTSGYQAEYAKDAVGLHPWKAGPVAGKLKNGNQRNVYLSRWLKPVREVPAAEVAQHYKQLLEGTDIAVPFNVVTPSLLTELEKAGVKIDREGSPMYKARAASKDARAYQKYDAETERHINESMTMEQARAMVEKAYRITRPNDWLDDDEPKFRGADDWLQRVGADEVAMYIDNDYNLQSKYVNSNEYIIKDDFQIEDVIEAYQKGTLTGKQKPKAKRLDTAQRTGYRDSRFYAPQEIQATREMWDAANIKASGKNKADVYEARKNILIAAHNGDIAGVLGIAPAELNKKLRAWSNYSSKARELSIRINSGVAEENRWTGIQNSSILSTIAMTDEDIQSMVGNVEGNSSEYQRSYIGRTMLALDTHIDWSWLNFEFRARADEKRSSVRGKYEDSARKVVVGGSGAQNTTSHEMGHALDYQWARDLFQGNERLVSNPLSENPLREDLIPTEEGRQFYRNFRIFIDSLTDVNDNYSSYTQEPTEVFARFVARFVEWTRETAGQSVYGEALSYNDRFTTAQYVEFAKLLQEKAMLDGKRLAAAAEGNAEQTEADEEQAREYQKYDEQISFDDMGNDYSRSQWNAEYRQRIETAEELTERIKDYLTQRGVDPEELEEYGARESYFNRSGDIAGASDMLRMISDLSQDMTGKEKAEAYELMEELLAHAESEALGLYTTNEDPRNPGFAEWYNKRNPSIYYPGYTPGDLMGRGQAAFENRKKEINYLTALLKRDDLAAEYREDAEQFLEQLKQSPNSGTFYQKYNPSVEETAEERDSRKAAEIRAREEKQLLHETVVSLNRELKKLNWKLSGGNEVREDDCLKLARDYKKTYGSTVNTQELAGDIKALGDYIVSAEELDDEKIRKAAERIAYKLIESAREVEDMWSMRNQDLERHQAAASWIQGKKFYFPENLRGDLAREGGYNAFRRANMGRFTLSSKDGDSIDALYTELHDTYPDLFPELTNEGDQIIRMAEIFEEAKPDMVNPYAYEDESFLTEVANGIYEDVLGEGIRQKAPSLMARVNLTEADIVSEAPALSGEELAKVQKDLAAISKELEAATTKASALEKRWETVSANEALAQKKLTEAEDRIQRLSDMLRTESLNGKLTAQQRLDAQNSLKKALAEKAKLEKLLQKAKDNTAQVRQERNEIRKGRREAELKRDSLQRQLNRETARNAVLKGKLSDNAQRTRDRLAALRAEKNARIAQIRAEGAAKVEEVRATEKAEKWARVASERERYQNMARRARERRIEAQTRGTLRKRITKIYNEFARDITHPTEGHHVPPEMMKQAVDVLQALNMDTSREGTKSGEKLKEKLAKLKVTYDAVQNDKDFRNAAVYDDTVSEMLQAMIEEVGDTPINQMTAKQMESVYNVLVAMRTTARTALKIKMQGEERDAYEVARKMTNEVRSGQKPSRGFAGAYLNTQLTPERMFNRLGGYHKDNTWSQVYRMLNEGQLESTRIFVEGSRIFEKLLNSKDYNGYVSPKNAVDIGLKDENGNAVPVTHDMLVSLWMHLQNEDNTRHAILGGLTIPNQKQYYAGNRARGSEEAVRVLGTALPELKRAMELREQAQQTDDEELKRELYKEIGDLREKAMGHATVLYNKVADNMTAYDRQWAAALSELFDVYSKEQLNKTTMEVYGIKRASVEHYWPINVDGDFLNTPFESVAKDFSIENAGFMKERVNSSKPIRLVGSSDVASSQLKKVSQYAGLMPVIRNFNKIWGKTQIGYQDSLKNAVHTVYGDTGVKYIENLMADLNGARGGQESPFGQALNKMRGNMAQAALTLSMRTAFGQTASYPTAAAVVGWKPLLQALAKGGKNGRVFSRADRDLIERYSPLLRYRSMGYSTTELGDISTSNNRMAQIWKKMRWLTGWIQAMDTATVGRLWYAAEYYVDDHNSTLKKGTDAYYEEVAKVFNDIVEKTQPDYTTMQRPDILRNPNALVRSLTMFMTQRLQNANIMYDAAATLTQMKKDYAAGTYGVTKEDVHQAAVNSRRAAASIIVAGVTITAFKFLADVVLHSMNAYRDDDKDLTEESVGMQLLDMFLDSMLGNILGGSEIYDLIESKVFGKTYYGIEVSGISTVSDVAEDMSKLFDKIRESGFKVGEYTKELNNMAKDVAQLLGIPLSNAEKIVMGIVNHGKDIANGEFGSFEAGVERKTSQNGHRLYRAYAEGDAKKVEKIRAEAGKDQDTLNQNLAGYIKDLYKEGEITEEEATQQLIDYAEVGKYTAAEAISKINFEKDFGFKFDDLKDRYLAGDMTSVETRNALVRYGGKTTESAKETVEGWKEKYDFDKRYGTEYEKYDLSFAGAKQYYLNYRSETTLEKFADQWKKYGATAVKNYYKNGWKNTGLTIEQYNKYGVDAPIYGDAKTQAAFSVWSTTLKPGGMTIERFMAFLKSADLDSNNSLKQDELGKALKAAIANGEMDYSDAEALWGSQGWKSSFKTWSKKKHK